MLLLMVEFLKSVKRNLLKARLSFHDLFSMSCSILRIQRNHFVEIRDGAVLNILRALQNNLGIDVEISEKKCRICQKLMRSWFISHKSKGNDYHKRFKPQQSCRITECECPQYQRVVECRTSCVIAGEVIQVLLLKEGKEPNQGVGYLDDGTMVIVEDGKPYIGV